MEREINSDRILFEVTTDKHQSAEITNKIIQDFANEVERVKRSNPMEWRDAIDARQDVIMMEIASRYGMSVRIGDHDRHYIFRDQTHSQWDSWN